MKNPGSSFLDMTTIQFIDHYNGWFGCTDDVSYGFYRTTDGGNTWVQGPHELYLTLGIASFYFVDNFNGWLAPILGIEASAIINTTDGGQTWGLLPEGTSLSNISSLCFINKNLGWAVGSEPINHNAKAVILRYKNNK